MDSKQLEKFKEQLEQMKAEIIADEQQIRADLTTQHGNIPDPNDRATMESNRGFELRIRTRERKLLSKVEHALARMDDGKYGVCQECGNDIRPKRLEARPVAKFCIDCKTKQEQQEKIQGH